MDSCTPEDLSNLCPGCSSDITPTFVQCAECKPSVKLCLQCFAKGAEFQRHSNDHKYWLKSLNFSLFSENWSTAEELQLLDAVKQCGVGNWQEISKQIQTKSELECEDHYYRFYVNEPNKQLPVLLPGGRSIKPNSKPFKASQQPPRPDQNSDVSQSMAGYMPCRGDFMVEYDDFAEVDIKDIDFNESGHDNLLTELSVSVLDIFWSRLKERRRRKKIIRDYGLLDMVHHAPGWKKQERILRAKLIPFARFHDAEYHEKMIHSFLHEHYTRKTISTLQTFREAGIKKTRDGWIYTKLNQRRQSAKLKRNAMNEMMDSCHDVMSYQLWMHHQLNGTKAIHAAPQFPSLGRRACPPLDISTHEGYNQLENDEKELCSTLRLLPEPYLNHKQILVKESETNGSLKLRNARQLIKIDVNKTRKLFDFFMEKGWIK